MSRPPSWCVPQFVKCNVVRQQTAIGMSATDNVASVTERSARIVKAVDSLVSVLRAIGGTKSPEGCAAVLGAAEMVTQAIDMWKAMIPGAIRVVVLGRVIGILSIPYEVLCGVIGNLLLNAGRACGGGEIMVTLVTFVSNEPTKLTCPPSVLPKNRSYLRLSVVNNLPIPEHILEKLFHEPVTSKSGGVGDLHGRGLLSVHRDLQAHNGAVNVGVSHGKTRVQVFIPLERCDNETGPVQ